MKKLFKFLAISFCIMMLGGCGAAKLSSNYSETKLKAATQKVVDNFNNGKYDDIIAGMSQKLKGGITGDKLKEAWTGLGELGKYNSISKMIFQEVKGDAVVVAVVKYDNKKVQLTLSYNKSMELEGIYIK
ncbi:DUF3887 domain-containing protein [Clostridium hydrogenum]|uniref:DUF3887 domain-containing protein n=1 Tax=Clostridium hydrogenum TaxID=2855764 RepID=UPI001F3F7999|nr:DUF3887 domain-containing protein [Clostridium hydrogenum]